MPPDAGGDGLRRAVEPSSAPGAMTARPAARNMTGMKPITTVAAAAFAAAAITVPTALGQSAPGRSFEVVQPFTGGKTTTINAGRKSIGPGDQFLSTGLPLLDAPRGTRIGTADGMETIVGRAGGGTVNMTGVLRLKDGKLHFGGLLRRSDTPQALPVLGGTGAYAGARGTLTASEDGTAKVVRLRVELL